MKKEDTKTEFFLRWIAISLWLNLCLNAFYVVFIIQMIKAYGW